MTFPVEYNFFGHAVHAHQVFELLGYAVGVRAYFYLRRRSKAAVLPVEVTVWIFVGAVFGAFLGSRLLAIIESFPDYYAHRTDANFWMQGKTIVGGLLGGWIGVEIAKRRLNVRVRTGDLYVLALALGIAIGRIGCFLEGLADRTHGVATSLPWGVDFGDGMRRHPTQLYESLYVVLLVAAIAIITRPSTRVRPGDRFRVFLGSYLLFRFAIEFIKPTFKPYLGLSAIQVVSIVGAAVCLVQWRRSGVRIESNGTMPIEGP